MTPEQEELSKISQRAQLRFQVIALGTADVLKNVYDEDQLKQLMSVIDNDLMPAAELVTRTDADLEASYSKRSRTIPGRTAKSKRKDPKSTKAKK